MLANLPAGTPYFYSSWEQRFQQIQHISGEAPTLVYCEANPSEREKIIILGSGPNRIGQGIEFDYVCVQGIFGLQRLGYEVIIVNCNPETVST